VGGPILDGTKHEAPAPEDAVAVRTLVVRDLPLLVADVPDVGRGAVLRAALLDAGLAPLTAFLGAQLVRGARVAIHLVAGQARLLDEQETVLMRAPRDGVDAAWAGHARRLRGTMLIVTRGLDLAAGDATDALVVDLDAHVRAHGGLGAIVGVHEERVRLPLNL
jgi:hypothetical protein